MSKQRCLKILATSLVLWGAAWGPAIGAPPRPASPPGFTLLRLEPMGQEVGLIFRVPDTLDLGCPLQLRIGDLSVTFREVQDAQARTARFVMARELYKAIDNRRHDTILTSCYGWVAQPILYPSLAQAAAAPVITGFTMRPDRIVPGTEVVFTLAGTPAGKATFTIEKIVRGVTMIETQPGVYEGRYTVRLQDQFTAAAVSARLEIQGQVARARLGGGTQPLAQRPGPAVPTGFPLEFTTPTHMSEVISGVIEVRGRSAPHLTLQVSVEATASVGGLLGLNQNLLTRTITTDNQGYFAFTFEPPVTLPGARYEVRVTGTRGGQEQSRTLTLVQR